MIAAHRVDLHILSDHEDLRQWQEAREQSEGTLEDLAKQFRFSLCWTKKILAAL